MAEAAALPERQVAKNRSKGRDAAEIAAAYGLILAVIWTPRPEQRFLWMVAAAAVAVIAWVSNDGAKAMGLLGANLLRSAWIVGAALLAAGGAVLVAAKLGTLRLPHGVMVFIATYCLYAVWSGVQQFLLQSFFLLRFLRLIPNPRMAALTAAALFATAHLPSTVLVPITFLWGFAACLHFLHYRNLYPLALAHAILGIAVAVTVPGPVDHNMRVGLGYLTYGHHRNGHRPYPVEHPLPKP